MRSGRIAAGHGLMFSWPVVDGRWRRLTTTWVGLPNLRTIDREGIHRVGDWARDTTALGERPRSVAALRPSGVSGAPECDRPTWVERLLSDP